MKSKKTIPKQLRGVFDTWEDYREWAIEKSKQQLKQAFTKQIENENKRTLNEQERFTMEGSVSFTRVKLDLEKL